MLKERNPGRPVVCTAALKLRLSGGGSAWWSSRQTPDQLRKVRVGLGFKGCELLVGQLPPWGEEAQDSQVDLTADPGFVPSDCRILRLEE